MSSLPRFLSPSEPLGQSPRIQRSGARLIKINSNKNQNFNLSSGAKRYLYYVALPYGHNHKLAALRSNSYSLFKNYSSINSKENSIVTELRDTPLLTIQKLFLQDIKYTVDCPDSNLDCLFFHEENNRNLFRKKLVKQSGIYMLKYKYDRSPS